MARGGTSRWPRIGAVIGAGVLLVAAALVGLALWLPGSFVARDLQATLSDRLGRPVQLTGGVHLTLWPIFGVEARGFSIGNLPGGQAAHLVEADAIDVGIAPLPLLSGRIEIHQVGLTSPRIHLEKLADGRVNWILGKAAPDPAFHTPDWIKDISVDNLSIRSGQIVASDTGGGGGRYGAQLDLGGVSVKALLMDLARIDRLEGQGRVSLNLTASGGNVDDLMHSLAGQASLDLANGAVVGVDMAAVSKSIATALSGQAIGPNARTAFSTAGGSFTLSRGVAATRNLALTGPGVGVGGVGSIDLGNRALDMAIKPQGAVGGGRSRLDLGAVPFHVHGPWTHLSYEPDLGGVARRLLGQQVGALAGGKGDGLGGLLQSLGGGTPPAGDSAPAPGKGSPPARPAKPAKPSVTDLIGGLIPH